jgi:hypothetical protein
MCFQFVFAGDVHWLLSQAAEFSQYGRTRYNAPFAHDNVPFTPPSSPMLAKRISGRRSHRIGKKRRQISKRRRPAEVKLPTVEAINRSADRSIEK